MRMHSAAHITSPPKKAPHAAIPPLQNGDHLTVAEFRRRYEAMPHLKKAELIEGKVYMPSPVRIEKHGEPHSGVITWLGHYWAYTPGTQLGDNTTLRLVVGENEPQPDGGLRILPEYGGLSKTEDGYIVGGIELAAEVSASSVSYDLHEKFEAFRKNGILEYIVWRVEDQEIDWFILNGDQYDRLPKDRKGLYKSNIFPGLWLDAAAMIAGNMVKVIKTVEKGIASPEHKRFVKKLQSRKK